MSPANPSNMIGYIRVSRVAGRDVDSESYQTEAIQRETITAWGRLRNVAIEWAPVDRDQSGAKLSRPGFDWAMKQIADGNAAGIVVATIDRLSRADVADALMIVRRIHDEHHGTVAAVDLGLDPTTEVGEMLLTVLLALARMQWRRYQTAWATARSRAVERGVRPAAIPLGYKQDSAGRLVPDPDTAPAIREAFRIAASQGLRPAVAYLQGAGLTSKRRHQTLKTHGNPRKWNTATTRRLLANRVYLGEIAVGTLTNPAAHEALADLATWTAANQRANGNRRVYRPRQSRSYPLSHVLRCASCDSPMVGNGAADPAYRCNRNKLLATRRGEQDPCPAPVLIAACSVELYVQADLMRWAATNRPDDVVVYERAAVPAALEEAESALRSAEMARDQDANDVRLRAALGDDVFYGRLEAHTAAVAKAQGFYDELATQAHTDVSWPLQDEIAAATSDELPDLLERCGVDVAVSPGRAPLPERVRLVPRDGA